MTERIPISTAQQLDAPELAEMLEGHEDGRAGDPERGNNRSYSYWHGWRNGAIDGGHRQTDAAQMALARDVVQKGVSSP